MAPKSKFSMTDIIEAAFKTVQKNGMEKLSARAIAKEMKSSTMPIYSYVKSMYEIEEAVVKKAWKILRSYQLTPKTGDTYLDIGLGYFLFAQKEKYLFQCIQNDKYLEVNKACSKQNFEQNLAIFKKYPLTSGLPEELLKKIMLQGSIFTHGLASLINSEIWFNEVELSSEEDIINFFIESNMMFWEGGKSVINNYK